MFQSNNIYVLNKKDKSAIIYTDADGKVIRLTADDFQSEAEFRAFKEWSDNDYHEIENARHIYSDNVLSLDGLSDEAASVDSAEDDYIRESLATERALMCRLLKRGLDDVLTPVQRRRLWLHYVDGLSLREIAQAENVGFTKIDRSIKLAKEKIKNILENS